MIVVVKESGPVYTNGYLVYNENESNAVIIDAPMGLWDQISDFVANANLNIIAILITHSHWDHTVDCHLISNITKAPVYVHQEDIYRISNPMQHTILKLPFEIDAVDNPIPIHDNDELKFGNLNFKVIHTPGHTEGGVCYVNYQGKIIFSGDTIFKNSIGRTDLPGGSRNKLLDSIRTKIINLPMEFSIYSGHGPVTTVGRELSQNPFLT